MAGFVVLAVVGKPPARKDSTEPPLAKPPESEGMMMEYKIEVEREQPAPGVTAQDIERWLDCDRGRLRRLEARRLTLPDEVLEAEIAMVRATIGQFEAELHYLAVIARQHRIKA